MATDQIEQAIDELTKRVEALEARERDRMAEHSRLEEAYQKAIFPCPYPSAPSGSPGGPICGP